LNEDDEQFDDIILKNSVVDTAVLLEVREVIITATGI
jgi:hypothetical protein